MFEHSPIFEKLTLQLRKLHFFGIAKISINFLNGPLLC
jgi:hypothetical protein